MNARVCRSLALVVSLVASGFPAMAQGPSAVAQPPATSATAPARPPAQAGKLPPPPLWWKSESFKKDLNLTNDQSNQIDKIFRDTWPQLDQYRKDLDVLEDKLSRMIVKNQPEPQIIRQISEVESKRGALNIARSVMLYHMRQVLTPQQRARFEDLHQKWQDDVMTPWQNQQERLQRDQRLNGRSKVGPEARPVPDPQKRPQQ